MRDMQAFSDVVVLAIQSALAPVLARVAAMEARVEAVAQVEKTLGDVRDRVLTAETKAAMAAPRAVNVFDDTELLDRFVALDAKLAAQGDRVVAAIETKAGVTAPDMLSPRLETLEATVGTLTERLSATERRVDLKAAETTPALASIADLTKDMGAMRERVAVVEVRAQVPGPPGKDGRDGADGMGWDDLDVSHDGERTFAFRTIKGDRVKEAGSFVVPVSIYRGVYIEGKTYERGDTTTWGGSEWHCNEATSAKPGEGSKAWTLKVKRGRDGKDAPGRVA